ncbi:type IV pilin [uncultured Methanocorpusculum sp.]|nr:type IV pilin [uncultured Methanocorpusculum sp.]
MLPAGSYTIFIDSVDKTAEFGGNVDFGPGVILSWDSGTAAVGTVSIVYTSKNGFSTLLAEKNFGKAGSTTVSSSSSGKVGKVVERFEDTYTIITKVDWQTFLDKVNASISGVSLGHGIVYVDNGEYWVSIDNKRVSKAEATQNPSIQEYMDIYRDNRLIMIDLSKKNYTESDMDPTDFSQPWKSTPYPTIGSLYEYEGGLYMDAVIISNIIRPSRDPNTADWVKIAYLK